MAAPTFLGEVETVSWDTAKDSEVSASFSVATNDVIVALGATEDANTTLTAMSGGGLTWTLQQSIVVASFGTAYIWTAVATGAASMTATVTANNATGRWGYSILRFGGSDGVGVSNKANTSGAPTLALTTTQANSAIVVINSDWNAMDGTTRTWRTAGVTPTLANGMERVYFRNSVAYSAYAAYYSDAGTAAAKTVGLSAPTGQKYSIAAIEIKGSAGAGPIPFTGWGIPVN